VLDLTAPLVELRLPLDVDVESKGCEAAFDRRQGERHADIAEADDPRQRRIARQFALREPKQMVEALWSSLMSCHGQLLASQAAAGSW
jgi:hypothetical protein